MEISMTKKLFSMDRDYGRGGGISGLFIATQQAVDRLVGEELDFGEALGKHSEVIFDVEEGDIVDLDIPEDVVILLWKRLGLTLSGYNPFEYQSADEEDE